MVVETIRLPSRRIEKVFGAETSVEPVRKGVPRTSCINTLRDDVEKTKRAASSTRLTNDDYPIKIKHVEN